MQVFVSSNRTILEFYGWRAENVWRKMYQIRGINSSIRINDELLRKAIAVICNNKIDALIVDLDSESDFVFVNAPSLGVRKYASAWEIYHPHTPQDFEEIGDADGAYSQILMMFNCIDATMPAPAVMDDWSSYTGWMKILLRDA